MRLRPGRSSDLFVDVPDMSEEKIIMETSIPNGDIYREAVIKGSIVIESSSLSTFRFDPDGIFDSVTVGNSVRIDDGYGIVLLDTRWDDIRVTAGELAFLGASNDPRKSPYRGTEVFEFSQGDGLGFETQLPHTYKAGTNLHAHVHWTPRSNGVAESGKTVAWKCDLSIARPNNIFPSETTYDMTATCDGVNDKHQIKGATVEVDGTELTISSLILGRVYRDTGDTWANAAADNRPGFLEMDFHFEINGHGSRLPYIK